MARFKRALAELALEGVKELVRSFASSAGSNLGGRVAPPKNPPPSGDEKEK